MFRMPATLIALWALMSSTAAITAAAAVPDNLVVDGVPAHPPELRRDARRYLDFRTATFLGWHPRSREMLIGTRFANTAQLHTVAQPGGARRQLTFLDEPVAGALFRPDSSGQIVFTQDSGGGEFYQLYRYDLIDGRVALLTDGKSRNTNPHFSRDGQWLFYNSTQRNGRDTDVWRMHVADTNSAELVLEVPGGGWGVLDVDATGGRVLVQRRPSINESDLFVMDFNRGSLDQITQPQTARLTAAAAPVAGLRFVAGTTNSQARASAVAAATNEPAGSAARVSFGAARFSRDGQSVICTTDHDSEFQRLARIDLATLEMTLLNPGARWDVESFELSPDGRWVAYSQNEDGISSLAFLSLKGTRTKPPVRLPAGVLTGLEWHENGRDLGFSLAHARSPSDAYSVDTQTGKVTRWTESETGGLAADRFREPELVRTKSFDGLDVSAFVYRPDPGRHPGPRPALIVIHGGPESQSRPGFMGRYNYFLDELGIALVVPNVRGSAGYGKSFLKLDDGFLRENSVKDIGAFLDWISKDGALDSKHVAVMGGSYGGYMTLASLVHYSDRLKGGVNIVGISSFLTFLANTQEYRRDLRRAEYGDERDPKMRAFLESISPLNNVQRIRSPLFVVQGQNDPRVPVTEAEQIVRAVRANGGACWYLMAKDEGHGFAKKPNIDFQFFSTVLFLQQHLLTKPAPPATPNAS
jgi:dipeptidyl aminopeptidase/acylaminoacyl peptidase